MKGRESNERTGNINSPAHIHKLIVLIALSRTFADRHNEPRYYATITGQVYEATFLTSSSG